MNNIEKFFNNNLYKDKFDTFIHWLETLEGENIKWKQNTNANQMVVRTDNYYYKIYICDEKAKFNSIIRQKLAQIYQSYGIDWQIITLKSNNQYIDIERRQKLEVCKEWSNKILINYSDTLKLLENNLEFDYVLKEIKKQYRYVKQIKLIRQCINNPRDYAIYKDKIILLDDTDWFISLINNNRESISIINPMIRIHIFEEDYVFTSMLLMKSKSMCVQQIYEFDKKFFLFRDVNIYDTRASLVKSIDNMISDNIKILSENNFIDIKKAEEKKSNHNQLSTYIINDDIIESLRKLDSNLNCNHDDIIKIEFPSLLTAIKDDFIKNIFNYILDKIFTLFENDILEKIIIQLDIDKNIDKLEDILDKAKYIGLLEKESQALEILVNYKDNEETSQNLDIVMNKKNDIDVKINMRLNKEFVLNYINNNLITIDIIRKYKQDIIFSHNIDKVNAPTRKEFLRFLKKYYTENQDTYYKLYSKDKYLEYSDTDKSSMLDIKECDE